MIIDCHVHLSGAELPARLIEDARRLGVDRLCVCSLGDFNYTPSHEQCVAANRDVVRVMESHPDLVIGFCYVNPTYTQEAVAEFSTCVEQFAMRGLKLWVSNFATDPRVFPVIEKAQELRVPVLMHAWKKATGNLPFESTPSDVAELARRFPGVNFIMAHIGGDWERGISAARGIHNLLVDTSGSIIECGMIESAVEALGAQRVVFGSDSPGVEPAVAFAKVMGADLSDDDRRLIMGENMRRLVRL